MVSMVGATTGRFRVPGERRPVSAAVYRGSMPIRLIRHVRRPLGRLARTSRIGVVAPLAITMRAYGTDKYVHGYAPKYEQLLRARRWRRLGVLEIGIGPGDMNGVGGSLRVWRDYFLRSTIVGIDIDDKDVALGPRVHTLRGDQASTDDLGRAVATLPQLDVVIDDGSHRGDDIVTSFRFLFPLLRAGGMYVIEDLHTSYWEQYGGAVPAPATSGVGLIKRLVDEVQAFDEVYARRPDWGGHADVEGIEVGAIHVYPGIVFIEKMR
jgi:hypothetical protein